MPLSVSVWLAVAVAVPVLRWVGDPLTLRDCVLEGVPVSVWVRVSLCDCDWLREPVKDGVTLGDCVRDCEPVWVEDGEHMSFRPESWIPGKPALSISSCAEGPPVALLTSGSTATPRRGCGWPPPSRSSTSNISIGTSEVHVTT